MGLFFPKGKNRPIISPRGEGFEVCEFCVFPLPKLWKWKMRKRSVKLRTKCEVESGQDHDHKFEFGEKMDGFVESEMGKEDWLRFLGGLFKSKVPYERAVKMWLEWHVESYPGDQLTIELSLFTFLN